MKILIIEDERVIRQELKVLLENALYEVEMLEKFDAAAEEILKRMPDLVLLDLNLPQESGFDICAQVRAESDVPVRGGDDYITKPFYPPVLLAHIAAVLKRVKKPDREKSLLEYKGVKLHLAKGCAEYKGKSVELSKNEMKILHCLFLRQGEIVPRMEMIEELWDNQVYIDDNSLSVNMTRLRNKLKSIGVQGFIETKRGMGYCI